MEMLEPRVLLSATTDLAHAAAAPVATGLTVFGDKVNTFVTGASQFDVPLPGVLQTNHDVNTDFNDRTPNGKVDEKDVHVPNAHDVLSLNVDRNGDGTIAAISGVDKSDPADVYRYFNPGVFDFHPSVEQALNAMDKDNSGLVDSNEIYRAIFVGGTSFPFDVFQRAGRHRSP